MSPAWAIPLITFTVFVMAYQGRIAVRRYGRLIGVAIAVTIVGYVEVVTVAALSGGGDGIIPGAAALLGGFTLAAVISLRSDVHRLRDLRSKRR